MDYSKVPLAKRTRLQHDLFYKKFNAEKKKIKSSDDRSRRGSVSVDVLSEGNETSFDERVADSGSSNSACDSPGTDPKEDLLRSSAKSEIHDDTRNAAEKLRRRYQNDKISVSGGVSKKGKNEFVHRLDKDKTNGMKVVANSEREVSVSRVGIDDSTRCEFSDNSNYSKSDDDDVICLGEEFPTNDFAQKIGSRCCSRSRSLSTGESVSLRKSNEELREGKETIQDCLLKTTENKGTHFVDSFSEYVNGEKERFQGKLTDNEDAAKLLGSDDSVESESSSDEEFGDSDDRDFEEDDSSFSGESEDDEEYSEEEKDECETDESDGSSVVEIEGFDVNRCKNSIEVGEKRKFDEVDEENYNNDTKEEEDECSVVEIKTFSVREIETSMEENNNLDAGSKSEAVFKARDGSQIGMRKMESGKGLSNDGKDDTEGRKVYWLDFMVESNERKSEKRRIPPSLVHSSSLSKFRESSPKKHGGISRLVPVEGYKKMEISLKNERNVKRAVGNGTIEGYSPMWYSSEDDTKIKKTDGHGMEKCENVCIRKFDGERTGEFGMVSGKKSSFPKKDRELIKILSDYLWREDGDLMKEDGGDEEEDRAKQEISYKFKFEDEVTKQPEKEEWEKEVDELFAEMNLFQESTSGESSSFCVSGKGDADVLVDTYKGTHCCQGKHELILNDQIGIICKFCSQVETEIKHMLPSFCNLIWEKQDRYYSGKLNCSNFSEFQFQDPGCERGQNSVYEKGTVWGLLPGIGSNLYPHQRDGFEFIWKNVAGGTDIEKLNPDVGSGCIISHAPGTGKSRLTIVFLQTYLKMYPNARPVIIAPRGMLLNWETEFKKWNADIPFHMLNISKLSALENRMAFDLMKHNVYPGHNKVFVRLIKLFCWKKNTSVLGITYRLFEELVNGKDEKMKKPLIQSSLLVLDEGHTPRNNRSLIFKALSKVETQRRIILSGTPFQNNFDELYNTLWLVNPKFAEGISSKYRQGFGKRGPRTSAAKENWDSLTSSIRRKDFENLKQLKAMMRPFVHVHDGDILKEKLPGRRDVLVVLNATEMQQTLFKSIKGVNNFKEDNLTSLIAVHPSLHLKNFSVVKGCPYSSEDLERVGRIPSAGVKTKFLIELIQLSEIMNEKVLVFSLYIDPLNFLRELLLYHFKWVEGREVLCMTGQSDEQTRKSVMDSLNDPHSESKVLLASIRACSEGISLVGASRVVLLDVTWNPSVGRQAVSRAYRIGQMKFVYIYHVITASLEGEKYVKQVEKEHLSELVFASKGPDSSKENISATVKEDKILEKMVQDIKHREMFEKVIYHPKDMDLSQVFELMDL